MVALLGRSYCIGKEIEEVMVAPEQAGRLGTSAAVVCGAPGASGLSSIEVTMQLEVGK